LAPFFADKRPAVAITDADIDKERKRISIKTKFTKFYISQAQNLQVLKKFAPSRFRNPWSALKPGVWPNYHF